MLIISILLNAVLIIWLISSYAKNFTLAKRLEDEVKRTDISQKKNEELTKEKFLRDKQLHALIEEVNKHGKELKEKIVPSFKEEEKELKKLHSQEVKMLVKKIQQLEENLPIPTVLKLDKQMPMVKPKPKTATAGKPKPKKK